MASEDDLWRLVAAGRQGVLATVARHGRPQLPNVLYLADAARRALRRETGESAQPSPRSAGRAARQRR
jgi:hypothetical protein